MGGPRALLVIGVAVVVFAAHGARAATITVDTTVDDTAINGNCTLREAVIAANTNAPVDACASGGAGDVIVVPAGTYVLTLTGAAEDSGASGDLDLIDDVDVDGSGAATTIIDGNATDRVVDVDPSATGIHVSLSALTIRNGKPPAEGITSEGGGVRSRGNLRLDGCTITHNRVEAETAIGGGLSGQGSLSVYSSTISDDTAFSNFLPGNDSVNPIARGGGIAMIGSLTLADCAISGNRADARGFEPSAAGGGVLSNGQLDITRSTVSNNVAFKSGINGLASAGGISSVGDFTLTDSTVSGNNASPDFGFPVPLSSTGGIGLGSGNAFISNSTITNNGARLGGGLVLADGALTLANATVSHNTSSIGITAGGLTVFGTSTVTLRNTIMANNLPSDCADFATSGPITATANAYNLGSDSTCGLSGSDLVGVDPLLGPLQNNGGPTATRALLAASPAREGGSPDPPGSGGTSCIATDQRGITRPVGLRCDIGAYEAPACGDGAVDSGEACDDGNSNSGDGCSVMCAVEVCYACIGAPSVCTPSDGAPCDDGNVCTAGEICIGGSCTAGNPTSCLDHYKCYVVKDLKQPEFSQTAVTLSDQFGTESGVAILRPAFVCNPVAVDGEAVNDPADHLVCYRLGGRRSMHMVETSNDLGSIRLRTIKSKLLCVPGSKTVTP